MDGRVPAALCVLGLLTSPAHAINHTNEYKTNMGNYRTCTDPVLGTCAFDEIQAPSKFYLPNNTTTTVVHENDGTVQLRIDAGGILTDTNVTYACSGEPFSCVGNQCVGGKFPGIACTPSLCIGGANHGGSCTSSSACPGGACTGGNTCTSNVCHGGLRDGLLCGYLGDPTCESVANSSGWSLVFRGNNGSAVFDSAWHAIVLGDGTTGLMEVCDFTLNGSGAINDSDLDCEGSLPQGVHHVEILDPDGDVVAIPTMGPALLPFDTWTVEGDPARIGDCSRAANAGFCP